MLKRGALKVTFSFYISVVMSIFQQTQAIINVNVTRPVENTGCEDIPPEGATFNCTAYAALGICDSILSNSCQLSCNRCVQKEEAATLPQSCIDTMSPPEQCNVVLETGFCNDTRMVQSKLCQKTCNQCNSDQTDYTSYAPNGYTNSLTSVIGQISPTPTPTSAPLPTANPTLTPAPSTPTASKLEKKRTCKSTSYKFVSTECRDGIEATISGGQVGTPPSYMISLQFPKNFGNLNIYGDCYEHFCGGSLIAPNLVLTAAHCVTGNQKATEIFGDIGSDGRIFQSVYAAHAPDCRHDQGFERIGVQKAYIFPGYSSNTFAGDVAVLELYGSLQGPYIQYQQAFGLSLKDNEDLLFMGYGKQSATERGYGNAPFITITMDYMADELCRATIEWNNNTDLTQVFSENFMVCGMVSSQGSTCKGDSGGPLVKKGATEKDDILVGIDSYRETLPCGIGGLTIFAELGFEEIMFWVDDIVQQHAFASGGIDWAKPTKLNG